VNSRNKHVYYMYALRIQANALGLSRCQLKRALDAEGVFAAEGYVRPIYLYPMYSQAVRDKHTGGGAGIWHGKNVSYEAGLCPTTERLHFAELLMTNVCRHDLGMHGADEFADAILKIVEHRDAVREKCRADGID